MSDPGDGAQPWWVEAMPRFGMRSLFHALCDLEPGADPEPVLSCAAGQPWLAELAGRLTQLGTLDRTRPFQPGQGELGQALTDLYAASRVRDVLLMAHQPPPADPDGLPEPDEALGRSFPVFAPVPVARITRFFALIGAHAVTWDRFEPVLHEIVVCEPAPGPDAGITVTEQFWPALMIGELVFTRGGVRVQAEVDQAQPGVADRSDLHWEYWRRYRWASDGSFWAGTNSQWRTRFRRDYRTARGPVYNLDAPPTPVSAQAGEIEMTKNRCALNGRHDPAAAPPDVRIDERR
jgi:hypothetical protein